jgi:phage tail sheath protein FI
MVKVTQDLNDGLNNDPTGKSVNPIREFTGKGPLVWGARTLDAGNLNWRFINVRREVIFIEESIKKALEHFVFQPNTANTWVKVKTMITAFLTSIWKSGGLAGAKAEDAFEVHIGVDITMTPIEIAQGIMNVELVLVPPRPAEVIVIKVSQKLQVS